MYVQSRTNVRSHLVTGCQCKLSTGTPLHPGLWLHIAINQCASPKTCVRVFASYIVTADSGTPACCGLLITSLKVLIALSSEWTLCHAWYLVMRWEVKHKLAGKEICIIHWVYRKRHHIRRVHTANYKIIFHLLAQIVESGYLSLNKLLSGWALECVFIFSRHSDFVSSGCHCVINVLSLE